jgi:hypothetical protein
MNPSPVGVCALAARVAELESANRRWKSANAIVLFFVAFLLLIGTRHAERVAAAAKADRIEPDVLRARSVEAQEFLLKDENGPRLCAIQSHSQPAINGSERPVAPSGVSAP